MLVIPPSGSNRRDSRSSRSKKSTTPVLRGLWFAPPPQPAPQAVQAEAEAQADAVQNHPVQADAPQQSASEPPKSAAA